MRRTALLTFAVPFAAGLAFGPASAVAGESSSLADQIVRASGIRAGLCVHLGVGDGSLTADLAQGGRFLVHGLDPDEKAVEKARAAILAKGSYGQASVERSSLAALPYTENLVNLAVAGKADDLSLKDVLRVLTPNGVLMIKSPAVGAEGLRAVGFEPVGAAPGLAGWVRAEKPRPAEMDDWPQWEHGSDRNPVSQDRLAGPPIRLRWSDGPPQSRGHFGQTYCMVSAKGRLFYPFDESETAVAGPMRMNLIARDAHNGLVLWRRPVRQPASITGVDAGRGTFGLRQRSLLATDGDRVYAIMEPRGPLLAMDAATGETVRTYERFLYGSPDDLMLYNGALFIVLNKKVWCVDPETGKTRWSVAGQDPIAAGGRVFVRGSGVVCVDAGTGREIWRSGVDAGRAKIFRCGSGVVVVGGASRGPAVLFGLSAEDGKVLWEHKGGRGVYIIGDTLWLPEATGREAHGPLVGLDIRTGKERKRIEFKPVNGGCTRSADSQPVTVRYHCYGRNDYVEWETGDNYHLRSSRRACNWGVLPTNGLMVTLPLECLCYDMLHDTMALAPAKAPFEVKPGEGPSLKKSSPPTPLPPMENILDAARLQKGPGAAGSGVKLGSEDWPTYRHDPARSGSVPTQVPAKVKLLWERKLGGKLAPATVAGGLVFVASRDGQCVHALDAAGGEPCWTYAVGGPVDTPPTIHNGLCLFGSRDGWVYCLNASDGKLVWRFRAAPRERRIVSYDRVESAWPVHGCVLVDGGVAYFAAGRHTLLDGGVFVYAADPATGSLRWNARARGACACDVLIKGTGTIKVRGGLKGQLAFDPATGKQVELSGRDGLTCEMGLTNPAWADRSIWSREGAKGHILVFDKDATYGVISRASKLRTIGKGYELFGYRGRQKQWSVTVPVRMRGLVLAGDALFAAGPPDVRNAKDPWAAYDGKLGGRLLAFSAKDGKSLSELKIDGLPVPDGLIAARGRLYLSATDGRLLCFGK